MAVQPSARKIKRWLGAVSGQFDRMLIAANENPDRLRNEAAAFKRKGIPDDAVFAAARDRVSFNYFVREDHGGSVRSGDFGYDLIGFRVEWQTIRAVRFTCDGADVRFWGVRWDSMTDIFRAYGIDPFEHAANQIGWNATTWKRFIQQIT